MARPRTQLINTSYRFTPDDLDILRRLAATLGLSHVAAIRFAIREALRRAEAPIRSVAPSRPESPSLEVA